MLEKMFPAEVTGQIPCITLRGMQTATIEQHRGVLVYHPEEVAFKTNTGLIRITGKDLQLCSYSASEALVTGTITGISLNGGEKR